MESATSFGFSTDRNLRPMVSAPHIARSIIDGFETHVRVAAVCEVRPPYALAVSLTGVAGRCLDQGENWDPREPALVTDDVLVIPEIVLNDPPTEDEIQAQLRPLFDVLWQAFGHVSCPYFLANGTFRRDILR
jgi:hypothetical protein